MSINLLSTTSRVETPFIIVTIGDYSFGLYNKKSKNIISVGGNYDKVVTTYPNFMQSLTVDKVNGTVNTYTLNMIYTITQFDDPNLLEKVFGSVSTSRTIKISYGDLSTPSYIYKEEECIITDIKSNFNIANSTITFTINCTSKALSLAAGKFSFPKRVAKPSDVIKEILYDKKYGLLEIFYGMRDKDSVFKLGLISADDRKVSIEAQRHVTILEYLNYLVRFMSSILDTDNSLIKYNRYALVVNDDLTGSLGGPYFSINKVSKDVSNINSLDTYEIDIGTFSKDNIISFTINDSETYTILYDYAKKVNQPEYIYRIDNNGDISSEFSPVVSASDKLLKTTESDKDWWTKVTQYPITSTLVIKGLLRPAILMSYVKLNVYFFGRKHISSGIYIITKQVDQIDQSGYKTTLTLTRVQGDDFNVN